MYSLENTATCAQVIERLGPAEFQWQGGYGAFAVSRSMEEAVGRYIGAQEEHHRRMTFQEELRELLGRHGIEFDEQYLWE